MLSVPAFSGIFQMLHDCQHHGISISSQEQQEPERRSEQGREERGGEEADGGVRRVAACLSPPTAYKSYIYKTSCPLLISATGHFQAMYYRG